MTSKYPWLDAIFDIIPVSDPKLDAALTMGAITTHIDQEITKARVDLIEWMGYFKSDTPVSVVLEELLKENRDD